MPHRLNNFHLRRALLVTGLSASIVPVRDALAHHGWSSFDQDQPLYLEGFARQVRWRNPHAEFLLDVRAPLVLPADLASRTIPAQSAPVEAARLLARARLPSSAAGTWEIELAPLFRLAQWQVPELKDGAAISLVGFALREPKTIPLMRAEFFFLEGRAYPMRSGPG